MIQVQDTLTIRTVGRVVERSDPTGVLDLRNCRFIDPVGMVALAVAAQACGPRQRGPWRTPSADDVFSYLLRMEVPRALNAIGRIKPDRDRPVTKNDQRGYLCELRVASSDQPAEQIGTIVWDRLDQSIDDRTKQIVWECLIEAWQNIPEHSGAHVGFAAAQVLERDTPRARIVIGIGDGGMGIAASLRSVLTGAGDEASIRAAVGGTSSTGDDARGRGLSTMRESTARQFGGRLLVYSGHGHVVAHRDQLDSTTLGSNLPGTIIGVEIPCGTA